MEFVQFLGQTVTGCALGGGRNRPQHLSPTQIPQPTLDPTEPRALALAVRRDLGWRQR
jgi:hypothetical protein